MDFLEILKIIAIGIIEGITEWLPISSTGHMLIFQEFVSFDGLSQEFMDMFNVVIQLGAIMAVVILFWSQIWPFALSAKERQGKTGPMSFVKMDIMTLWFKILVSCVPAAVIGVLFDDVFTTWLFVKIYPSSLIIIPEPDAFASDLVGEVLPKKLNIEFCVTLYVTSIPTIEGRILFEA